MTAKLAPPSECPPSCGSSTAPAAPGGNVLRIPDRQGHIYGWTRQTMTRLGEMCGFRLDAFGGTYLHPPIPIFALLARSIVYRFVKAEP